MNLNIITAQATLKKDSIPSFFIDDFGNECMLCGFADYGKPMYDCTDNNLDIAKNLGTNILWQGAGFFNVSGQNFSGLGLFDGGLTRPTHREFNNRIILRDSNLTASSHATMVAGVLIASGIDSLAKGHANQSSLNVWSMSNDVIKMRAAVSFLRTSNHSYSAASGWLLSGGQWYWYGDTALHLTKDYRFGFYDTRARQWDSLMYSNEHYIICKSAGNNRGAFLPPNTTHFYWNGSNWQLTNTTRDTIGPYDCIPTYGNAKNIITVGSNQFLSNQTIQANHQISMLPFSSFGPTDDGRIKPDMVAPSGSIYTTNNLHDSAYGILGGTSASSPSVAASIHLLNQMYHQKNSKNIYNALLKAVLINSCISCQPNGIGPGYNCGWGFPRFDVAARYIKDSTNALNYFCDDITMFNNDTIDLIYYRNINDSSKITIAWTDPPAISGAPAFNDTTLKLINDLDMVVLNLQNQPLRYPFVLNPNNPNQPATTGNNNRDNVEQILQVNDTSGFYKVRITHKNILTNFQQKVGIAASHAIFQPIKKPTNLTFSQIQQNSLAVSFTKGSGIKRLVIMGTQPLSSFPQHGFIYQANDTFGLGSSLPQNNFVVYNDTGNFVLIKNLQPLTNYFIQVIEYNGNAPGKIVYANNMALSGSTTTLSVDITKFNGKFENNTVKLFWQTAFEKNNLGFELSRSVNGEHFNKLAFIKSFINTNTITNYTYTDAFAIEDNHTEKLFYKLTPVGINKNISKSKIISVQLNNKSLSNTIHVYPMPFNEALYLKTKNEGEQFLTISIIGITGKKLCENKYFITSDEDEILIKGTESLNPGMYFLQIDDNIKTYLLKIVKN